MLLLGIVPAAAVAQSTSIPISLDVQGHRGLRGLMPENSMPGFKKALALAVPTLELDVQVTRDRVLVVHHDPHLDPKRCRYDDGREVPNVLLEELRYADLANIDCGHGAHRRFPAQQAVPRTRIPRLEQVLALAQGADYPVHLSLEIKWHKRKDDLTVYEFAERLIDLIKQYKLEDRTLIESFYAPALRAVRALDPAMPRAILLNMRHDYARVVSTSTATILSPRYPTLRAGDVPRLHHEGVRVIPWTVNKPAHICRLIRWGVDGIISDYPERVLKLYKDDSCYFRDD